MLFSALTLLLVVPCVIAQRKCNGFAELCDRSLGGDITFIGTHDSFAYDSASTGSTVGVGLSSNQFNSVSQQLADGVRMLQGQGHHLNSSSDDSSVELCHSSCSLLDGGTLTSYLEKVVTFLEANQDEVIILLWVNSEDRFPVSAYGNSYVASGLDKYSYTPEQTPVKNTDWPTLGELIDSGKRAITFMDIGADTSSVPYILDEFSMIFETVPDPQDNNFACTYDRPHGGSPDGRMYMINHNLNLKVSDKIVVPDLSAINTTNAACGDHTIQQQVSNCLSLYNRNPNIILLDYYNYPANDPFKVANHLNGVGPDPCASGTQPSGTSAATSTHGTSPASSVTDAAMIATPTSGAGRTFTSGLYAVGMTALALNIWCSL